MEAFYAVVGDNGAVNELREAWGRSAADNDGWMAAKKHEHRGGERRFTENEHELLKFEQGGVA